MVNYPFSAGKGKMGSLQQRTISNQVAAVSSLLQFLSACPAMKASLQNKPNLKLAPGGHVGLFCMDELYGTWRKPASLKNGYNLPMHKMTNTDLSRILKNGYNLPMYKMTNTDLSRILKSKEIRRLFVHQSRRSDAES
ncbi:60S ribosomal protein L4-like [Cyclopterus lumpus]|uniref:60S ribosomal protein L4-like n=1 Tax=Cyclopterus lumpus TaxID=8103 RepID=UPI0014864ADB|nr:60S ribosomal protein L4-like [Cyclopterus lumpus]